MPNEKIDLTKGGSAVVMVGNTGLVKEYLNNPAVKFIDCKLVKGDELEREVPSNTKVVIITEGLPQYHSTWIFAFCKRRDVLYLTRKSNQAIYETLKGFFPTNGNESKPTLNEIKETQVKGKLNALIPFIDFTKSNAEAGRILYKKARELSLKTTEGSVIQFVAIQRRKHTGVTAVPRSVRSQLDISVELLDNMVRDLSAMRDYLIATTEENRLLREKQEKFKKLLE